MISAVCSGSMDSVCTHVHMRAGMNVEWKVPVNPSHEEQEKAEQESHRKTDQIKICPRHSHGLPLPFCLRLCWRRSCASGFNTWSNRSASLGVSKIAPNRIRQPRESSCRATSSSACETS